ncbi:uncharacterized protein LOC9658466 isoform X3 [Selaginella moellendorffii]|uniref:uncharacterized protein LOC9658466 isoform X3 n=1 Tax=Selaginella moellendorffii TaxID=88036 RepID=UPI000D1C5DD5|nr:uncharacterized protein LOC9658466 isoform X3 [Selaginella moellendorffii]|eukprot:XP_024525238.1 uncharacterized protein LOC9658466 isoform X3 [Selaginella moellendorffii]
MKLFIEVEVGPDEIPLATELFKTLRLLTDHVKTRDLKKLFTPLILRLKDSSELDRVASEITLVLTELESSELVFDELIGAFEDVVFSREMVMRQESVVPYMLLFPRLPERLIVRMKETFIPKVLKHLTLKRSIDASRMEFFSYAEAFASIVQMEFVPLVGAVQSIVQLLRKQETRCAAVTMLGKTVELCLQQLNEKCDLTTLSDLRAAVHNVTEGHFVYDINYIEESMGWNLSPTSVVTSPRPVHETPVTQSVSGLHAVDSFHGHKNTVFTMAYDSRRDQLLTGAKDGSLIVWSCDGQLLNHIEMPHHYACSMDVQVSSQSLLVCGVAREGALPNRRLPPPCIFRYGAGGVGGLGWKEKGCLPRETTTLIACIKALGALEPSFITGETTKSGPSDVCEQKVCYYDLQSSTSFTNLKPLRQYVEHEDLITCLSLFPPNPNIFMSASRDCTIRVWDRRADRCTGMFGALRSTGRLQAHDAMITCLDATDANMIVSASMDKFIHRWDYRTLSNQASSVPVSSMQIDDSGILKLALKPGTGTAAISTLRGLYFADFFMPRPSARLAQLFPDGRHVGMYHDLKWSTAKNVLYAAGDDTRIDVYSFRP